MKNGKASHYSLITLSFDQSLLGSLFDNTQCQPRMQFIDTVFYKEAFGWYSVKSHHILSQRGSGSAGLGKSLKEN